MLQATLQASAFSVVMLAVVYWPLERMWPARKQPWLRPALGTDFLFLFGQHLVWSVLALSCLVLVDAQVHAALPDWLRAGFLTLPRWAQLTTIVVLGDLGVYWFHRACHRFDVLWRFHAVHHSSQTLDWVAAHREHPVDGLLTQLTLNLPAILLGFPVEGLAALAVFRGLWAIFIHSNVRLPLGPLRYVLGAPELHHWHHAKSPGQVANYGNLSPWTDLVFGTFHLPPAGEETWALGVPEQLPTTWPGLLVMPFKRHWTRSTDLLQARVLGPLALAGLMAITFSAMSASAASPDAGVPSAAPPDAVVMGSMDKRIIQRVIRHHSEDVKKCAEAELIKGAAIGKVTVRFVIGAAGAVTESKVSASTITNPHFEECLTSAVSRMKFPSPEGGVVIVTYPFLIDAVGL